MPCLRYLNPQSSGRHVEFQSPSSRASSIPQSSSASQGQASTTAHSTAAAENRGPPGAPARRLLGRSGQRLCAAAAPEPSNNFSLREHHPPQTLAQPLATYPSIARCPPLTIDTRLPIGAFHPHSSYRAAECVSRTCWPTVARRTRPSPGFFLFACCLPPITAFLLPTACHDPARIRIPQRSISYRAYLTSHRHSPRDQPPSSHSTSATYVSSQSTMSGDNAQTAPPSNEGAAPAVEKKENASATNQAEPTEKSAAEPKAAADTTAESDKAAEGIVTPRNPTSTLGLHLSTVLSKKRVADSRCHLAPQLLLRNLPRNRATKSPMPR